MLIVVTENFLVAVSVICLSAKQQLTICKKMIFGSGAQVEAAAAIPSSHQIASIVDSQPLPEDAHMQHPFKSIALEWFLMFSLFIEASCNDVGLWVSPLIGL